MQTSQLVQTVLLCLVTIFMTLRIFTRWGLMRALGLDDYLSMLAFCIYIGRAVTLYVGLQDHQRVGNGQRIIIANWLMILLYTLGTWLIKLSFSVTLYQIVRSRVLGVTVLLLAIATTMISIFEFLWTLLICRPITKLWTGEEGSCHPGNLWGISLYVHGGVLLVVDIVLGIVLPIILLRKLQMRMVLKVSVVITIAVGSLASIATVARLFYTSRLFNSPKDAAQPLCIWVDVEFGISIICTAAITLKPLLRRTGLIFPTSVSGIGRASLPTYLGHDHRGMQIRVQDEVAVWSECDVEGVMLVEHHSKV